LFRKLGPRVLLVKNKGKLVGLITKKDVLDFIEETEASGRLRRRSLDAVSSNLEFDSNVPLDLGYDLEEFRFRQFTPEEERGLIDL
jgi:CBS domain-containing protein